MKQYLHPLVFFVLCRLTVLLFFDAYITDVSFYLSIAEQGLRDHQHAYQDFAFGYPPLALLFVYLPAWLSHLEFWSYWRTFRAQMFGIDLLLFFWIAHFLIHHLKFNHRQLWIFVLLYSLFGFLQGHLLYDRLDLLIVTSLFALFYVAVTHPHHLWPLRVLSLAGLLIKFVPFLYALVLALALRQQKNRNNLPWNRKLWPLIKESCLELLALLLPFLLFLQLYQAVIADGVFKDLNMHFQRGIQVESLWATPVIVYKLLTAPGEHFAVSNFGAQHLDEQQVPLWYLEFAKLSGTILLGIFGLLFFLVGFQKIRKFQPKQALTPNLALTLWLNIFCIFLTTQRVLSPQFFLWLTIPLAILPALRRRKGLVTLSLLVYLLTFIGFDIGYWEFVNGNRFYVSIVALRNLSLAALTILSLRHLQQELSSQPLKNG